MPAWVAFGALTLGLIGVLLLLSIASARTVSDTAGVAERSTALERSERVSRTRPTGASFGDPRFPRFEDPDDARQEFGDGREPPELSTGALLANVALTQGLFGAAVLAAAVYFAIPLSSLGFEAPLVSTGTVTIGIVLGFLLWIGNEVAAAVADAAGVGYDESVRSMLAPDSIGGWILLFGLILPTIAIVEELLFRGAAIGAFAVGFGLPEPLLVLASSIAFGGAHGAQGRIGAIVATALGLVLAVAFVLTGSLFVVVLAHYLVNALEFLVHEGLDVDRPLATVEARLPTK